MSKFKSVPSILFGEVERKIVITCSGSKTRPNYKPKYTESGAYELVEDGVIHSYEEIQAWKATCDMSSIIERYIRTGDSSLLNQRAGFYADVTALPKDYIELANTLKNADNFFNALPVDVREKFDFNPAKFYAEVDDIVGFASDVYKVKKEAEDINPLPAPETKPIEVPVIDDGGATVE